MNILVCYIIFNYNIHSLRLPPFNNRLDEMHVTDVITNLFLERAASQMARRLFNGLQIISRRIIAVKHVKYNFGILKKHLKTKR